MKQPKSRHQFTFYHSYIDCVMGLPKCRRFETLLAIIFYALDGTEPQLSGPSEALFRAVRPNVDSSRSRAEAVLRAREKAAPEQASRQGEDDPEPRADKAPETAGRGRTAKKKKYEYKFESKSEKETEKEYEYENESSPAADSRREGAAGDALPGLSLSAGEREDCMLPEIQPDPELPAPYARMLEDGCLRVLWETWLSRSWNGGPPSARKREALLKALKAAPPDQRATLLISRIREAGAEQ